MESMPSTVVRLDSSKVKASVVRRSSTRPMILMGCMDELNCEVTDTTGVVVETDMLTMAVESLDVLIERPRATHDHPSAHRIGEVVCRRRCCHIDETQHTTK